MNKNEFLAFEGASRDSIDVKRCYVDMAGDLVSGVLLSQIVYWHLNGSDGESRLRVFIDGHFWLAKARGDWWEECRISPKQFDRSAEVLETKELIFTTVKKFSGSPTKHIRLNWDVFLERLAEATGGNIDIPQRSITESPDGEIGSSPKVNNEIDESGTSLHTENPSENPTEITQRIRTGKPKDSTSSSPGVTPWAQLSDAERSQWCERVKANPAGILADTIARGGRIGRLVEAQARKAYEESRK